MSSNSRLIELAEIISSSTSQIQSILSSEGSKPLSFDEDAPAIPLSIDQARSAALDATAELNDLLTDPFYRLERLILARLTWMTCVIWSTTDGVIRSNDEAVILPTIASLVPFGGQISFADTASKTSLSEQMVARIIRHAATIYVFREPQSGFVAHTQASKLLANADMNSWVLTGNRESTPAVAKLPEALAKWPGSQKFGETGYTIAHGASFFEIVSKDPARAMRFGTVQSLQLSQPPFDTKYRIQAYDWASLGEAQVVEIGGGMGRFALPLARQFPGLRIIVQDMPQIVQHADAGDLADRVKFEPYDYLSPQKVHADVFSFRHFFQNWSDQYVVGIIKAQVPALESGNKIIVQQQLLPVPGVGPRWRERQLRASDIEFAAFLNGRERSLEDWKTLVTTADPGFQFKNVIEPEGSALAILEFVWQGSA